MRVHSFKFSKCGLLLLAWISLAQCWARFKPISGRVFLPRKSLKIIPPLHKPTSEGRLTALCDSEGLTWQRSSLSKHKMFDETMDGDRTGLTTNALTAWERQLDVCTSELRSKRSKSEVLDTYRSMLASAASKELNPLQTTAFKVLTSAAVDTLLALYPKDTPITALIDEVTDVHFSIISELFDNPNNERSEDENLEQAAEQKELLCYQFAGLVQHTYVRISLGMGSAFDTTASTQELRRNVWLAPVLSRLQRKCVLFSASAAEERIEEITKTAFAKLLKKLKVEVIPRYTLLRGKEGGVEKAAEEHVAGSGSDGLPAWELAHFVQKVLRNSVQGVDVDELENEVNAIFRDQISDRMRALMKPLERIVEENALSLPEKWEKVIEELVNLGHESVAAVLSLWQVRHNIVGVPGADGVKLKDYLRPVLLRSSLHGSAAQPSALLESLPRSMRDDVYLEVNELCTRLRPDPTLHNIALLSDAVRRTAAEEFRALSTYNTGSDDLPTVSRDSMYATVLGVVLADALTAETFQQERLYEDLLAFAALEETWGVREPRAAAAGAFSQALTRTIEVLIFEERGEGLAGRVKDVASRLDVLEKGLSMVLRMPGEESSRCRTRAFEAAMKKFTSPEVSNVLTSGEAGYRCFAELLGVDCRAIEAHLLPLRMGKFDKAVGELLLNADVAVSVPTLAGMFEEQVRLTAEELGIPPEQAQKRTLHLAAAVLSSFLCSTLTDGAKMGARWVDAMLRKGMYVCAHPTLQALQSQHGEQIPQVAVAMTVARVGRSAVVDLIRVLEQCRQRAPAQNKPVTEEPSVSDWGAGLSGTPGAGMDNASAQQYSAFLQSLQTLLLAAFSAAPR